MKKPDDIWGARSLEQLELLGLHQPSGKWAEHFLTSETYCVQMAAPACEVLRPPQRHSVPFTLTKTQPLPSLGTYDFL